MRIWLGVENFAKIKKAKICINSFTILVGQNNSGKTFLMQLAQGVGSHITEFIDEDIKDLLIREKDETGESFSVGDTNQKAIEDYLNQKLDQAKDRIVRDIFGKQIAIDRLYLELELDSQTEFKVYIWTGNIADSAIIKQENVEADFAERVRMYSHHLKAMKYGLGLLENKKTGQSEVLTFGILQDCAEREIDLIRKLFESCFGRMSLFIPAARAGLLLTYREFFANKTDDAISYTMNQGHLTLDKGGYAGLTRPVYEFLRFLLKYSEDEDKRRFYEDEIHFFEGHLLEGNVIMGAQGNLYFNEQVGETMIPIYLASSMINEIASLELALTSAQTYDCLILDEAETSLHPEKQMQMVRFLNRLSNKGMNLIVSTHSDTFVSKVNNLYLLAQRMQHMDKRDVLKQFDLQREDLVDPERLLVYEFVIEPDGKSVVKEITGDERSGYQFDQFTASAMKLYEEAVKVGELQKND